MSIATHLTGILDKANAGKLRAERTIVLINALENGLLNQQQERALAPVLEELEESPVPSESDYAAIDDLLDQIEAIL